LQKREFGPWVLPAFRILARLKGLRGTALDIFGYTEERRRERRDIADYEALLDSRLGDLSEHNYGVMQELFSLPLKLRGFGHVKDRNRDQLDLRRQRLLAQLDGTVEAVQIVEAA
jgi:indolepyruvate ferredoxin oxidoreductase